MAGKLIWRAFWHGAIYGKLRPDDDEQLVAWGGLQSARFCDALRRRFDFPRR